MCRRIVGARCSEWLRGAMLLYSEAEMLYWIECGDVYMCTY